MSFSELFNSFYTIFYKEVARYLRLWKQTFVPPIITMSLYYVIFGNLIGPRIGEMDGYDYMSFIVPGLVMLSVITGSYGNVVSSFYGNKFQRSLEEILVSPTPSFIIFLGFCVSSAIRGILVGIIVILVSLFFTELKIHSLGAVVLVACLTSFMFSAMGMINAIYANSFDDITIIPNFVLTPLTYLGGIFYSIKLLPEFWQDVSLLNPMLYIVNAFRYGMLGKSDIPLLHAYSIIIIFTIVLSAACIYMLDRGIGTRS
ncbi:MAG: ABC transporter permease [Candidatus Portiera sp.]|nr:ABC transporter permease [Portiera sp.]